MNNKIVKNNVYYQPWFLAEIDISTSSNREKWTFLQILTTRALLSGMTRVCLTRWVASTLSPLNHLHAPWEWALDKYCTCVGQFPPRIASQFCDWKAFWNFFHGRSFRWRRGILMPIPFTGYSLFATLWCLSPRIHYFPHWITSSPWHGFLWCAAYL